MKVVILLLFLVGCQVSQASEITNEHPSGEVLAAEECDRDIIIQRVLDYVEGWYGADAERMERTLSEYLTKRRIGPDGQAMTVDKSWMVEATGQGRGQIENPEQARKEISILSQTESMASVMLVSEDFVDYIHLAKSGGKWEIVNVIWDYLPES